MEKQEIQKKEVLPERVLENVKFINHFAHQIPLPQDVKIYEYTPKHTDSKKKKKLKNKFESFTYYQDNDSKQMLKILFLTDDKYVDQGKYPFTQPEGTVKDFKELSGKRMRVTEAAYIGHVNDQIILKKIEGVKLGQNGLQFETVDNDFEVLKIDNEKRFNQFMKLMTLNKNSISMSIRVMIDQSEGKPPRVLDYEFFYREKQLINKHSANQKSLNK